MGFNNLREVKKVGIVILVVVIGLIIYFASNSSRNSDYIYKPLIKCNNQVYGWVEDNYVPRGKIREIGKVEKSYNSSNHGVSNDDSEWTSNTIAVGIKIYLEETEKDQILVKIDKSYSRFEPVE